ncbi:MAG: bacterio-opsin activator domain-containing protein [Haloarculaceae archaeon]
MTGATVLVAGADPELVEPISDALEGQFVVLVARDAEVALRRLRTARVDALLVGAGFADGGPLAFLRETRALVGPELPVLVLTGDASLAASALEAGATDYADPDVALEHPTLLVGRVRTLLDGPGPSDAGLVPTALYTATRDFPAAGRAHDAIELGLRVETDDDPLVRAAARADCRLTLAGITPRPGGGGLLRVDVHGNDDRYEAVRRTVQASPGVVEAEPIEGDGEALTLLVSELGLLSHLADHGATVGSLAVDPEGADVTVGLPGSADVRSFVETCRARYPGTELVARREYELPDDRDAVAVRLPGELTDRQREALLAAYREGYFEWPRESTGEEIAERLGVSAPTFHQHLRKGLGRLLDAVTEDVPERGVQR